MIPPIRSDFIAATQTSQHPKPKRKKRDRPGAPKPVSVRMSADERQQIEREAGERTLSDYIRARLFGTKGKRGTDRRPSFDSRCLAQLLGILGKSNLVPNVEALAHAARSGTLEEGPALLNALEKMRTDLAIIRHELLRGLGVKPG